MQNDSTYTVSPINAFDDNYIWLISGNNEGCVVVDPGDADPVIEIIEKKGLELTAILITHKHYDHVGGIDDLKQRWPDLIVYGPANEAIKQVDIKLSEGDQVELNNPRVCLNVLDVPGHTEGHIAYHDKQKLFCGDTLFAGGCGRVFSGTFEQLSDSLQKLAKLANETLVYCAHEYTLANLGFATWVEPDNNDLKQRIKRDEERREQGLPTVPSSLKDELETNPFMRTGVKSVLSAVEQKISLPVVGHQTVFRALREWKDQEYD